MRVRHLRNQPPAVELPPINPERIAEADAAAIREVREADAHTRECAAVTPTQTFSYFYDQEGKRIEHLQHSDRSRDRLQNLMPLLRAEGADDLMAAAAARAYGRQVARTRRRKNPLQGDALANEIHDWVQKGFSPPPHMRFEDAHLFEEEACFQYLDNFGAWPGLDEWRALGFFPDMPVRRRDPFDIYTENVVPPPAALSEASASE